MKTTMTVCYKLLFTMKKIFFMAMPTSMLIKIGVSQRRITYIYLREYLQTLYKKSVILAVFFKLKRIERKV